MAAANLDIRRWIGRAALTSAAHAGRVSLMLVEIARGLREWRIWLPRTVTEAWNIGVGSLFIVLLVSSFAGAVTAFQTGYQFKSSLPIYVVGTLVVSSIVLELGPVLTGLILAGRIGARYAAELGTMRVTEQIDALESLGRSPVSHLIIPRVVAGFVMIPALTVLSNVIGILAGWRGALAALPQLTNQDFIYGAQYFWRPFDAVYSLIKSVFFAGAITIIPCYMGFNTQQGAEGVGKATTGAVVSTSVIILLLDAVLAKVLLNQ
jgi:phospholipid/cholesterol/gamma-HCH transport system permease protein